MKRLFAFIILMAIAISPLSVICFANESADLSFDDAVSLVREACLFFQYLQLEADPRPPYEDIITLDIPGYGRIDYAPLPDNNGVYTTAEECRECAGKYFVPELVDYITVTCLWWGNIPLFYEKDGVTYRPLNCIQWSDWIQALKDFRNFRVEGDTAFMDATMPHMFVSWKPEMDAAVEIRFIKTEDGWRLGESSLTDLMTLKVSHYDYYIDHPAPATGDSSATVTATFAVLAVVSAVIPAVIMLRRIKEN